MEPTTPTSEDVEMNFGTDEPPSYTEPPPHVAARFHRKPSVRRKSSANSSRRSSLSSIHSHSSALSSHGGPRSTHIAQHLRRASIIESRKARLADRAAHAEQVRLRAAAAKAAQRASYNEEKALAAQAAREKLLAEIAARCEEEVKRAKKIAEETKEKKAAELARLKEEMAEKYAEADRRRSMYQQGARRSRTTSLAAVEEKKVAPTVLKRLNRVYAAKVIQRSWRRYHTRKVLSDFSALGLDLQRAKALSFEELTQFISDQRTTAATTAMLRHVGVLDNGQEDTSVVRVFLSAYLILTHPIQAFSHGGSQPQEQELMTKSRSLIETFESCIGAMMTPQPQPQPTLSQARVEAFAFALNDFTSTFDAWKSGDLGVLVDIMVNSFVNLDLILQATKDDHHGHVAEDYLDAVRQEQVKLLARLKRLAGPEEALSRVRTAVRRARKQRAAEKRPKGTEQVPRASTPAAEASNAAEGTLMTPPATPRTGRSDQGARVTAFPDSLSQMMTLLPSNREIAHEILINGSFEVQQQPWTDARQGLMDSLRKSMRADLRDGDREATARWTHSMAGLIREKLMLLISPRHPLYATIDGFLDPALISQQCRNGMFSYDSFFKTIAGLIAQICSPGRDEIVSAFGANSTSDTVDRLFELINIIDLMSLDHINFQFRLASQAVLEHGHEHEIASFGRDLEQGVHTLARTRDWWAQAKSNVASQTVSASVVYARGLTDLVLRNSHLSHRDIPETLQLDYIRLLKLRARVFHFVAISAILLTTKIRLRRNRESLWAKDAERLMGLDLLKIDASRVVSLIESSHMMPESTKEGLANFVGRVLPSAVAATRNLDVAVQAQQDASLNQTMNELPETTNADVFSEQIASFLLKTLREHVFARLSAASTAERVRTTTGAGEVLARAGMPEFLEEVNRLVDTLDRVRSVDWKCHEKWYGQIAGETARI
ncbi:uncharacterized protein Z520_12188 [Fonsecaea multimorphosa CBS 102226]|uniref:IQ calmodulin-binding motif domain protein n=1 Tax=Fonsecaea multimorphosa CBS 102226 TaxID=1442371 RepID=A0A0D2JNN7_9EURO|nr:uncharacterized protein Z520_12188 [Fonsecaea multimorphosa CBS 102226]KIX92104.1 hypothetical protein Z520_12188 [Fonsecaea multimorphosa CBS 102226]OAL17468.1 hypothetical protein AYO22_11600 [Fonsecaea multimorphosa]